jgi:hypothetical protein
MSADLGAKAGQFDQGPSLLRLQIGIMSDQIPGN